MISRTWFLYFLSVYILLTSFVPLPRSSREPYRLPMRDLLLNNDLLASGEKLRAEDEAG